MNQENDPHVECDVCHKKTAYTVKGGKVDGKRGLFMVCKECEKFITDERKK